MVLCSHLGRPKGKTASLRMAPVAARLSELLGQDVVYIEDSVGEMVEQRCACACLLASGWGERRRMAGLVV